MTQKTVDVKELVKQKYSDIARSSGGSCCGPTDCCGDDDVFNIMAESYKNLEGYNSDADLSLGCGIPVEYAGLKPGQSVLDLGSGAGNDLFVARSIVGESGQLTGLDFSEEMLKKAEINRKKLGYSNMRFVQGDIENMPLPQNEFDVVLSNCVLNLVPDKKASFAEIFRVLKPGGHFSISDIVLEGEISEIVRKSAELYAGCVSGAINKQDYLDTVEATGFIDMEIRKEREIDIPEDWLKARFGDSMTLGNARILSITLYGKKPTV